MSSPVSVDPAQVRRIVDKARAFVDAFEQLREPAQAAGVMDWFEFHRRSIQRQWDELRGVVSHADAHRFLPVVDAIIGNGVPLEQGPPGVSVDAVNAALDALASDRIERFAQ